jgi:hypothetical protein
MLDWPLGGPGAVLDRLIAPITAANNHITTGSVALGRLFRVLQAAGRNELLYKMERTRSRRARLHGCCRIHHACGKFCGTAEAVPFVERGGFS